MHLFPQFLSSYICAYFYIKTKSEEDIALLNICI